MTSFTFFDSYDSPLSNLRYTFFVLDGQEYNSAEQYFQFQKAKYFNNPVAMEGILKEGVNPLECKKIGEEIDTSQASSHWTERAIEIMKKALLAKVCMYT